MVVVHDDLRESRKVESNKRFQFEPRLLGLFLAYSVRYCDSDTEELYYSIN